MRRELLADRLHPHVARIPIVRRRTHLDELVGLQRTVDLGQHLVGEALVADDDERTQLVRFGSQLAAALGVQFGHPGSIGKSNRKRR
jgi:hypothetical protein